MTNDEQSSSIRRTVGAEHDGVRLDRWLVEAVGGLSRAQGQRLIREGFVRVNGSPSRASAKTRAGDVVEIEIHPPAPLDAAPEDIPLDVLYEDADVVVVNKPSGLVVHPAPGHGGGTLVNALLYRREELRGVGDALRPGIVHRLDKDTSGLLVVARHESALHALGAQFQRREVEKRYVAVVHGRPERDTGRVAAPIGRSRHDRKKMSARAPRGREALTEYEVVERYDGAALLRVRIATGRTHQIRVHMAHIGHPVAGDVVYGKPSLDHALAAACGVAPSRQMLHAERLTFRHPRTGQIMTFEAPWPPDLDALVDALRRGSMTATGIARAANAPAARPGGAQRRRTHGSS